MSRTYCVVFASRVLTLTLVNLDVLHADLLTVVGGRRPRKGQQKHVDDTNVGLTRTGGNPRVVMVPYLIITGNIKYIQKKVGGSVKQIQKDEGKAR